MITIFQKNLLAFVIVFMTFFNANVAFSKIAGSPAHEILHAMILFYKFDSIDEESQIIIDELNKHYKYKNYSHILNNCNKYKNIIIRNAPRILKWSAHGLMSPSLYLAGEYIELKTSESDHCLFLLGSLYEFGDGVILDKKEAAKLYTIAADNDHPMALFQLANMYLNGHGVGKDRQKAIELFHKSAQHDIREAQYALSRLYHGSDEKQAVYWLRKAADNDYPYAQLALGDCYLQGHGVDKNLRIAEKWYNEAAGQGLEQARIDLLELYNSGVFPKNNNTLSLYRQMAEQGDPFYQMQLGLMYARGEVIPRDVRQGMHWLEKARAQGSEDARIELVNLAREQLAGGSDELETVEKFRILAAEGDNLALYRLGLMYLQGQGVPINLPQAIQFINQAAENGLVEAQLQLADMHENGHGMPKDPSRAYDLCKMAAKSGQAEALLALARMFELGLGTAQDFDEALKYYTQADAQGHDQAKTKLSLLARRGYLQQSFNVRISTGNRNLPKDSFVIYLPEERRLLHPIDATYTQDIEVVEGTSLSLTADLTKTQDADYRVTIALTTDFQVTSITLDNAPLTIDTVSSHPDPSLLQVKTSALLDLDVIERGLPIAIRSHGGTEYAYRLVRDGDKMIFLSASNLLGNNF